MTKSVITKELKTFLESFFKKNKKADLLATYLSFIEKKMDIHPVLFIREKMIYKDEEEILKKLEEKGKLWRETEIKIQVGEPTINLLTKKIYICPFTGKVFGDNTHPNPQDAIYDWVSQCPENKETIDGMKVKRFFISEDPEIIKNYIKETRAPISKIVFSSVVTGKLFNSKKAVIEDFRKNQLKPLSLLEVPSQNRFQIEEGFLAFIQDQLEESKIAVFVEELSSLSEFKEYASQWVEE